MSESIVMPRRAAEAMRDLIAENGLRFDVLDAALSDAIDWSRAEELVRSLLSHVQGAEAVHLADQTASSYVAFFARFGIDLRDERALFQFLVTLAFVTDIGHVAVSHRVMTHDDYDALVVLIRSIGAVVAVLAPVGSR